MRGNACYKLITDKEVGSGTLNLFAEIGLNVEIIKLSPFKRTKANYLSKQAILELCDKTNKNDYLIIYDYLTYNQRKNLIKITNRKVLTKSDFSNYFSLMENFSSKYMNSIGKEVSYFLTDESLSRISTNHGLLYVDSYDEKLIKDVMCGLKLGKVDYRYKKSKEFVELYPNLVDRLPLLTKSNQMNLVVVNNNILPLNKDVIEDLIYNYDFDNYDFINDQCYNNEYLYLIRLGDMANPEFVDNLIESLPKLFNAALLLKANHLNIVFLSYGYEDFKFFQANQDLFGESLFIYCDPKLKDLLALSIFETTDDIESLYANVSTYFNHIYLENTTIMKLRIPDYLFPILKEALNFCRVNSCFKSNDYYLVEAHVPNYLCYNFLEFEESDEAAC